MNTPASTMDTVAAQDQHDTELCWEKFSKAELEKQYSPSQWSPFTPPETTIASYLSQAREDIQRCRDTIPWRTVAVGDQDDGVNNNPLMMDVYGEDLPPGSPVLVFVHGGYWQELNKDLVGGLMGPLYRQGGVVTIVLSYTTAPTGQLATMVSEVARGLAQSLQLAEERGASCVVTVGWSAGAQLVLEAISSGTAGTVMKISSRDDSSRQQLSQGEATTVDALHTGTTTATKLRGVVAVSGVFDLRPLVDTYVNDPLKLSRAEAWLLSPSNTANCRALRAAVPSTLPILIATAEHDSPQFRSQAELYVARARSAGFSNVDYYCLPSSDHFKIISDLSDPQGTFTRRLLTFVEQCARPQ